MNRLRIAAATAILALACAALPAQETTGTTGTTEKEEWTPQACTVCDMKFDLRSWSVFYKTGQGEGLIECDNGQQARVILITKGGGITFGKSEIRNGTGRFTEVRDISDLFGTYVAAEAHAGAGQASNAQVMTKGEVSLTLVGTGTGVDVGFAFGKLEIKPAE